MTFTQPLALTAAYQKVQFMNIGQTQTMNVFGSIANPTSTQTASYNDSVADATEISTLPVGNSGPLGLVSLALPTGGTFAAGTYFWVVTAMVSATETARSPETTALVTGTTGSVVLTWLPNVVGATGYKVYRGSVATGENILVTTLGNVITYTDTGSAGTPATTPSVALNVLCPSGQHTTGATRRTNAYIIGAPAVVGRVSARVACCTPSQDFLRDFYDASSTYGSATPAGLIP